MLESNLVDKIRLFLHKQGMKTIKVWGTSYTENGTPDIVGSFNGRFVGVEVKTDTGTVSPMQYRRLLEWRKTGARVGVATTPEEALLIAKASPTCKCSYCEQPTRINANHAVIRLGLVETVCPSCKLSTWYKEEDLYSLQEFDYYAE